MWRLPALTKQTLSGWLLAFQCKGAALGIQNVVTDISYDYDLSPHCAVAAFQSNNIITSLSAKVSAAVITSKSSINPARLIQQICSRFHLAKGADHMTIKAQADNIRVCNCDDVRHYFQANEALCVQLISADYLGIADEHVTIKFLSKV